MKPFIAALVFSGVALALPAAPDNEATRDVTVEAANFYTEFGWQGNGKRDTATAAESTKDEEDSEVTVETANFYTEFGWQGNGKRDTEAADKATVEAANGYTEFGWVGNGN